MQKSLDMPRSLATISAFVLVASCAVALSPAPAKGNVEAAQTAKLQFLKGYDKGLSPGAASVQRYAVFLDGSCLKTKRLAYLTWSNGPAKVREVPAGKLIRFEAEMKRIYNDSIGFCHNLFSFSPEAGHTYSIVQKARVDVDCYAEVIDDQTGLAPTDLEHFSRRQCTSRL